MIKINNEETLTAAAFRYALGRSSYIVSSVVEDIIENIDNINNTHLKRMKEEIEEAINENRIGMKMDKRMWLSLIEEINEKFKKENYH